MFEWSHRYQPATVSNYAQLGTLPYYALIIIRQVDAFAIPAFLFVSGFFVAFLGRGKKPALAWGMAKPRIKVLLVPWVIWTSVHFFPPTSTSSSRHI